MPQDNRTILHPLEEAGIMDARDWTILAGGWFMLQSAQLMGLII